MGLFKEDKEQDERVVNLKNKIYREIYTVIIVICAISVVIKLFSGESASTEVFIIFASTFYYLYRSVQLGIISSEVDMQDRKNKRSFNEKNLIYSLLIGVGVALVMGLNSAVQYADGTDESIKFFLVTSFGTLMIYLPILVIVMVMGGNMAKRKSDEAVDKMLDDEEDDAGDDDEKH